MNSSPPSNSPPLAGPRSTTKLALLDGFRAKRVEAERAALELLKKYREDPAAARQHTAQDLLNIMESVGHNRGSGEAACTSYNRIAELKYLLGSQKELSANACATVCGIGATAFAHIRRQDPELDQMVRDYQAGFFEEEAMTGDKGLHPALVIFGLKARAGWMDAKDRAITLEQLTAITEQFMAIIKEELKDQPEVLDRISRRLSGEPLEARVESIR